MQLSWSWPQHQGVAPAGEGTVTIRSLTSPATTSGTSAKGPKTGTAGGWQSGGQECILGNSDSELAATRRTGGEAYYDRNDVAVTLEDAVENGGSYYEITYAPTDPNYNGQLHKVEVSLSKKGYHLEYRRFYYADDPNMPLTTEEKRYAAALAGHVVAHQLGDTMYAYMEHGSPEAHQVLFRAHVSAGPAALATPEQMANLVEQPAYFVIRKKKRPLKPRAPIPLQTYTIDYLVLDAKAGPAGQQILEFAAGAYDAQGRLLNGISQNAIRPEAQGHARGKDYFRAVQTLDVPTTAAWLRVGVRDVRTDQIGTIEIPLPLHPQTQSASGDAPKVAQ